MIEHGSPRLYGHHGNGHHAPGVHCSQLDESWLGPEGSASPTARANELYLDRLRRAVELGSRCFDTADSHGAGNFERLIGRLIREHPKSEFQVSSKVGQVRGSAPHPYAGLRIHHQFQQTQENLGIERLDVYSLASFDFGQGDRYLGTAIDQMNTLRDLGDVGSVGMRGPHAENSASLIEALEYGRRFQSLYDVIKPDVIWTRLNLFTPALPLDRGESLMTFTARHGSRVLLLASPPYPSAQESAFVAGLSDATDGEPGWVHSLPLRVQETIRHNLQLLCERFGYSLEALFRLAVRVCIQRSADCVLLVDCLARHQGEKYFAFLQEPLSDEDLAFAESIYARIRAALTGLADAPEAYMSAKHQGGVSPQAVVRAGYSIGMR